MSTWIHRKHSLCEYSTEFTRLNCNAVAVFKRFWQVYSWYQFIVDRRIRIVWRIAHRILFTSLILRSEATFLVCQIRSLVCWLLKSIPHRVRQFIESPSRHTLNFYRSTHPSVGQTVFNAKFRYFRRSSMWHEMASATREWERGITNFFN